MGLSLIALAGIIAFVVAHVMTGVLGVSPPAFRVAVAFTIAALSGVLWAYSPLPNFTGFQMHGHTESNTWGFGRGDGE